MKKLLSAFPLLFVVNFMSLPSAEAHGGCVSCVKKDELREYAATCKQAQFNYAMRIIDRVGDDARFDILQRPAYGWEFNVEHNGRLKICSKGYTKTVIDSLAWGKRPDKVTYQCQNKDGDVSPAVKFTPDMLNTEDKRKVSMVEYLPSCNAIVGIVDGYVY